MSVENTLPIRKLTYEISASDVLPFQGRCPTTTLRGAFGYSLIQLIAREETIGDTEKVEICKNLFYCNNISDRGAHENSPRPFVLRGGFTRPDNKSFILEMILVGRAISSENLVDNIVKNMCSMGLGKQSLVCSCIKLRSEDIMPELPDLSSGVCIVNFQTPTRIKSHGRYFRDGIPFKNLFGRLADRLKELMTVYTEQTFDDNNSELEVDAENIGMLVNEGTFYKAKRRSSRTGEQCELSGFVGNILYTGNLEPFAEILAYLPWINVGSSTAFGCGWCTLEYNKLEE